jgi:hypothetical protein
VIPTLSECTNDSSTLVARMKVPTSVSDSVTVVITAVFRPHFTTTVNTVQLRNHNCARQYLQPCKCSTTVQKPH